MALLKVIYCKWALIFIIRIRFPPWQISGNDISRAFLNNSYTRESASETLLRNMLMYACMHAIGQSLVSTQSALYILPRAAKWDVFVDSLLVT